MTQHVFQQSEFILATSAHQSNQNKPLQMRVTTSRPQVKQLLPLIGLFYSFLLFPPEVSFSLGGLWLPVYRVSLIAGSLFVLVGFVRGGRMGLDFPDICVYFASFWIFLSFVIVYDVWVGTTRGAGVLLDVVGSYLLARTSIRSFHDFRYFLLLCLPGLAIAAGIMAAESLSGRLLYRPSFSSIFGSVASYSGGEANGQIVIRPETRLGLLRAYGPFSHPILGGLILGVFLPLIFFSGIRSWPWWIGMGSAFAGIFSLSSAAILGFAISIGGIGLDFIKNRLLPQISWWTITFLGGMAALSLHVVSKSGLIAVLARFTLVPHTASYRVLIWEFGTKSVAEHPWFGIGYQQWERLPWMGESIDAHFLMLAVRHGFIVPMLILVAAIYSIARLGLSAPFLARNDRRLILGVIISMTIMLVAGQTVAFFGASQLVFMAILGFTVSLMSYSSEICRDSRQMSQHAKPNVSDAQSSFGSSTAG